VALNQVTLPALDVAASAAVYRQMGSDHRRAPGYAASSKRSPNRPQEDEMEAPIIRRSLIAGGELQRLVVEDGLGGGGAAFSRGEPGPPRRPVSDVVIAIGARARTSTRRAGAAIA
jgi:hypothetical protein